MRSLVITAVLAGVMPGPALAQSGEARRALTQVTDSVWRFDNNFHVSMVVVTDEGAVVGDPTNADAAAWLEAEIMDRFGIGEGHGDDMVVTIVRPDDVAFVVDMVSPGRLPYQTTTSAIDGMIEQIQAVEALDFDNLLPGHAANGT